MNGWRVKLIEMIDEIDGVSANDTVIIMDLIKWLPADQIERFINDTLEIHEFYPDGERNEEETLPPQGEPKFFSSLIPEC